MKLRAAQLSLLAIFLLSLVAQTGLLFAMRSRIWDEEFPGVIQRLLGIYGVHIGLILGSMFARAKTTVRHAQRPLVAAAIVVSVIWNCLLLARTVAFSASEQDSTKSLLNYFETVGTSSAFLVTGVLGFFFTNTVEDSNVIRPQK